MSSVDVFNEQDNFCADVLEVVGRLCVRADFVRAMETRGYDTVEIDRLADDVNRRAGRAR